MGAEVLVKLTMDPQELYKLNEHYHYVRALENQADLVCTNGTGFFGSHQLYGHSQIISRKVTASGKLEKLRRSAL